MWDGRGVTIRLLTWDIGSASRAGTPSGAAARPIMLLQPPDRGLPTTGDSPLTNTRHALLFFLPTAANGLVSLAAIPLLILVVGTDSWTRIAIGQAVGSLGMTLVTFGWSISGPATIGAMPVPERPTAYAVSVTSRLVIGLPVAAISALGTAALLGERDPVATISAASTALLGLSGAWFFIGTDRPLALLVVDTLPKVGAMALGLGITAATHSAIAFPLSQGVGVIVALGVGWALVVGRRARPAFAALQPSAITRALRQQSSGVLASLGFAAFAYAPLPLVTIFLPGAVTSFAVVDKLHKLLLTAASPLGNVLTARMAAGLRQGRGDVHSVVRQGLAATAITAIAALPLGLLAAALLPLISAGSVQPAWWLLVLLALMVSAGFAGATLPAVCLAPLGRMPAVVHATLIGTGTLVLVILLFARSDVPLFGALVAVTVASFVIVAVEAVIAGRGESRIKTDRSLERSGSVV